MWSVCLSFWNTDESKIDTYCIFILCIHLILNKIIKQKMYVVLGNQKGVFDFPRIWKSIILQSFHYKAWSAFHHCKIVHCLIFLSTCLSYRSGGISHPHSELVFICVIFLSAAACEFLDIVELLLQSGADPALRDQDGCVPEEVTGCKAVSLVLQRHVASKA